MHYKAILNLFRRCCVTIFTVANGLEEKLFKLWHMMCQFQDIRQKIRIASVFGKQKLVLKILTCFSLMMGSMNQLHSYTLVPSRLVSDTWIYFGLIWKKSNSIICNATFTIGWFTQKSVMVSLYSATDWTFHIGYPPSFRKICEFSDLCGAISRRCYRRRKTFTAEATVLPLQCITSGLFMLSVSQTVYMTLRYFCFYLFLSTCKVTGGILLFSDP